MTGKEYCIKCCKTKVNKDILNKMRALKDEGFSTRKITSMVGLGKSTVAKWLKGYCYAIKINRY